MKRTSTRAIALLLAILLLASMGMTAIADTITGDLNGDGKVTVFDAQLLLEAQKGLRQIDTDLSLLQMLQLVLGGMPGAYDTDSDGVTEIYSASGLKQIAHDPAGSYILMNDIDMAGDDWLPIAKFTGTFNGNGKTVSNLSISSSRSGMFTSNPAPINQGFFGDTGSAAVIKDLHLRNVTLTATEDSRYIGLLIGSNRGKVENCTVTGTIVDERESYPENVFIGVLAGRICTASANVPLGSLVGGTSISVTDDAGNTTTTDLCADVKLQVKARSQVNAGKKIGLAGWAPATAVVTGNFCESTAETDLLPQYLQDRRATVMDYMIAMGTVAWTPSETLVYKSSSGIGNRTFKAGTTYYGLPYTGCNGSMERFQLAMNPDGTTKTGLGDSIWNDETGYSGFATLMGNVCTTSIAYAWSRISSVQVAQQDDYSHPYRGGVYLQSTLNAIPTPKNRAGYGIYPVGDWENFYIINEEGLEVDAPYDESKEAYHCTDEVFTVKVLENNGADRILEAYTKAYGGDMIVTRCEKYAATVDVSGHTRMLTADPIVIRTADGVIDQDRSYLITTEQGASSKNSSWRVNYRYSFRTLLDDPADSASSDYAHTYLPVTMRALHDDILRGSYVTIYPGDEAVTAPDHGRIYSNFRILSTTVIVKDGDTVIYEGEVFTGMEPKKHTGLLNSIDISCHGEGFHAAAQAAGLETGSYTFDLLVMTADGKTHTRVKNMTFDYTAPENA